MFLSVCKYTTYMNEPAEGVRLSGRGTIDVCKLPCGNLEPNTGSPQEK